jgi:glutamate synthase domain-containing protein 2
MTLIDDMGLNLPNALPIVVNKLIHHGLRQRVRVIASGKLVNPVDVAWALCTGADCVVTARGFLLSIGCIQALQCNKNTCPTGITTHDKHLQRGLVPEEKAERVAYFHRNMMKELNTIAHSCGVEHPGLLNRRHASMVLDTNHSVSLESYYEESSFH